MGVMGCQKELVKETTLGLKIDTIDVDLVYLPQYFCFLDQCFSLENIYLEANQVKSAFLQLCIPATFEQ
jgi:hypothetical protein